MSIEVVCPVCHKRGLASDAAVGKAVKCSCGQVIAVRAPGQPAAAARGPAPGRTTPRGKHAPAASPPPEAREPDDAAAQDGQAAEPQSPQADAAETKQCPFCSETILAVAKKCKHCGEFLDQRKVAASEPSRDQYLGSWQALIWCSLLVPFIGAWVVLVLCSAMYFVWKKTLPKKARTIMIHGLLAFVAGNVLWSLVYFRFYLPGMIGKNEDEAVGACKTFAEAEDIYRRTDWHSNGILEYAQSITGNYSLFERQAGAADLQLVDPHFALASDRNPGAKPKHGYLFAVLTGQGPGAPGGAKTYVTSGGQMTVGYGLVAYPAVYGRTGRLVFQINSTGTVYATDAGWKTDEVVKMIKEKGYDPKAGGLKWFPAE